MLDQFLSKILNIISHPFLESHKIKYSHLIGFQNGRETMIIEKDKVNTYDARKLLGPETAAKIVLDQVTYFLKITKQNKLILTK